MGDSQHTQNIQVNKVICENEKCIFLFYRKNYADFLGNSEVLSYTSTLWDTIQEIDNILKISKIIEVIGDNEKCIFYFMEKTKWTFWPTQYVHVRKFKLYGRYKIKSEILFALPSPSFS